LSEIVNKTLLEKIIYYLKDFKKEKTTFLDFLDKGAIMKTDKKKYYLKFDSLYWINAGKETGRFRGAGFSLNAKFYNIVNQLKLDILYTNPPSYVYHYYNENYEKNSFNHIQDYNGERVRVISIDSADDVWNV
jgi:hypothetical protein